MKKYYDGCNDASHSPGQFAEQLRQNLPCSEYMRFIKLWDILVITADSDMIYGCDALLEKNTKVCKNSTAVHAASICLSLKAFL